MFHAPTPTRRSASFAPAFRSLDSNFERFVNEALAGASQRGARFEQDETSWTLSLDLPGLAKEELSIGIEGAVVRIASTQEAKRSVKAAYELPQEIDAATSEAKLENGVLTLKLAKQAPVSKEAKLTIA
ncbi:MAG: Hsp20/alpha crystallin family protein [Burkholderiales bacterium]